MQKKRTDRLNSLLREVIAEVIKREVKNPQIHDLSTITRVDITADLHYAKVYVSIIGDEAAKRTTLEALRSAAGFIAVKSSKKVVMRYFPTLSFILDEGVEKQMRIEELLQEIKNEESQRHPEAQHDGTSS